MMLDLMGVDGFATVPSLDPAPFFLPSLPLLDQPSP